MTLMVHKYITALEQDEIPIMRGAERRVAVTIARLRAAEKFDFGPLHLEPNGQRSSITDDPVYRTPKLTDDENAFLNEGLIPLPAPLTWYEFVLNGFRSGVLVRTVDGAWIASRMDYNGHVGFFDGTDVVLRKDGRVSIEAEQETLRFLDGNPKVTKEMFYGSAVEISRYLTLMLNSRTTEIVRESAPDRLNKARITGGKCPLFSHRVVTIVPERFKRPPTGAGTHASPRLHWRNSHLRTYDHETPGSKFIEGRGHCVVIPRCLVGKAELGEVTHEYRVRM